jgi:hypothetical protein
VGGSERLAVEEGGCGGEGAAAGVLASGFGDGGADEGDEEGSW